MLALSDLEKIVPDDVAHLQNGGRSEFYAATVFRGVSRTIVFNDAHHPLRQTSDIAHELAHGILAHPPTPPISEFGCRNFDAQLEAEANWLGPALLVSREAALLIARQGLSLDKASKRYGVSKPVVRMRLNVTGARRIVERTREKWRR